MMADERAQEQRRIVQQAAKTVLVWVLLIGLFVSAYTAAAPLLRRFSVSPPSEDVIVFGNFKKVTNQIIWVSAFAFALLFGCAAMKSARRALIAALLVLSAFWMIAFQMWFAPFAAIRFHPANAIELQYLWPRPSLMLDPGTLRSLEIIESLEHTVGPANDMYQLQMETDRGRFRSMRTGSRATVQQVIDRIQRLRLARG